MLLISANVLNYPKIDFNATRGGGDDYDRRQGFSNRGGFGANQQMRGNRSNFPARGGGGSGSFSGGRGGRDREGRDGNMRGGNIKMKL